MKQLKVIEASLSRQSRSREEERLDRMKKMARKNKEKHTENKNEWQRR